MNMYLRKTDLNMGQLEYDMYQEIPRKEMGAENHINGLTYVEFRDSLKNRIAEETHQLTKKLTPRIIYIMYVDNYPVGEISIRTKLNEYWKKHSGNIGYKIRPTERKKGYGTKMLELALEECKRLGLNEVLLQCNNKNMYSRRVIEKNNGVLINSDDESYYFKIIM